MEFLDKEYMEMWKRIFQDAEETHKELRKEITLVDLKQSIRQKQISLRDNKVINKNEKD